MSALNDLVSACQREAEAGPFPIDVPIYEQAGRPPQAPILWGGNLDASVCFFARDLGRDEVMAGEPLRGAAGRAVRTGVLRALGKTDKPTDADLAEVSRHVFLCNTVPFKPPGNKAYSEEVRRRFRPFLLELLTVHYRGPVIIPLGTEAFLWFAQLPGAEAAVRRFWERPDRYSETLQVVLRAGEISRPVTLAPLPHPSPLNQTYFKQFPEMLGRRLAALLTPGRPGARS